MSDERLIVILHIDPGSASIVSFALWRPCVSRCEHCYKPAGHAAYASGA